MKWVGNSMLVLLIFIVVGLAIGWAVRFAIERPMETIQIGESIHKWDWLVSIQEAMWKGCELSVDLNITYNGDRYQSSDDIILTVEGKYERTYSSNFSLGSHCTGGYYPGDSKSCSPMYKIDPKSEEVRLHVYKLRSSGGVLWEEYIDLGEIPWTCK